MRDPNPAATPSHPRLPAGGLRALPTPTLVAAATVAVLIANLMRLQLAGDAYWDLAAGRWMWDHHAVLTFNALSWSHPHAPWVNTEWLWGVLLYAASRAGMAGLLALASVGVVAFYWGLTRLAQAFRLGEAGAVLLFVWAAWVSDPGWKFRPQAWGYPAAVWAMLLVCELGQEDLQGVRPWIAAHRRSLLALLVLSWGWSQFHGSWILLPLWLILEAILHRQGRWLALAAAVAAVASLNPYGPTGVAHAFYTAGSGEIARYIQEWQPPSLHNPYEAITLVLYLFGGGLWIARSGWSWRRWSYWAGFALAALWAGRFIPYLALGGAWVLQGMDRHWTMAFSRRFRWLVAAVGVGALALGTAHYRGGNLATGPSVAPSNPVKAVDYLLAHGLTHRVFNMYPWGGYLAYRGIPDWIDGRADFWLTAGDNFQRYVAALEGTESALSVVTQSGAQVALVAPRTVFAWALLQSRWHLVYRDATAMVFVLPPAGRGGR